MVGWFFFQWNWELRNDHDDDDDDGCTPACKLLCARLIVIEDLQQIILRRLLQQHMDSADADNEDDDDINFKENDEDDFAQTGHSADADNIDEDEDMDNCVGDWTAKKGFLDSAIQSNVQLWWHHHIIITSSWL